MKGDDVHTGRTALQSARIPLLLVLLLATGWSADDRLQAIATLERGDVRWLSALTSLVSLLFVIGALVGRRQRHPWTVLATEVVLATPLAVVPAIQWVAWVGFGGTWRAALLESTTQPLAMAWLGVVGVQAVRQLRHRRSVASDAEQASHTPAR